MDSITSVGFTPGQDSISDKLPGASIKCASDCIAAGYVDKRAVIGTSRELVEHMAIDLGKHLCGKGLVVHEEESASLSSDFVGLHFKDMSGVITIRPHRLLKNRAAIMELLHRNHAIGCLFEVLLGHLTWAMLCRRETLCIVDQCYAFVRAHYGRSARLWPSVRRELRQAVALLPLMRRRIASAWCDTVTASDSSPFGYGVCYRSADPELIESMGGGQSEKWRFHFEDAINARRHCLEATSGCHGELGHVKSHMMNELLDRFNEVPKSFMSLDAWTIVWSRPWPHQANLLHTEALALVGSVKHQLRAKKTPGSRILARVDNLLLALSVMKGRARSSQLKGPHRMLCSLAFATHSALHVRWIPSEWNIAGRLARSMHMWKAQGVGNWWDLIY